MTCDPERIELFLQQKLSDEEQTAFELHLDDCNDCRHRLEATAAGDDIWSGVRDSLLGQQLPPDCLRSGDSALDSAAGGDASFSHGTVLKLLAPTDDDRMIGRLGTYEVVGVIGSGGMGVVLKAFDAALNRYVAIKVLAPHLGSSGAARKRFSHEAQAAAAVVHENVIEIHGVADTDGLPYLVMPYVRGPSLQRRLDCEGPLALVEILRIGMQAATGLAAAHAQGLVHRDVKPANILLADGVERVKLTDFGLARAADDASLTKTGIIAGTPQYMSPEQARGESVGQRSDLFSLGSVLYAMCTGRAPFRAETSYGVLRRITDEEPHPIREINPDIPEWLCQIIAKLMSKQPDDRFESAREVAELLEECLAHVQQPTAVLLPEQLRATVSERGRCSMRRLFAGTAFALTLLLAGVVVVLELNKGTLTIESDVDDVSIRITQGDKVVEKLTVMRSGTSVRIAAGKYVVEIDGETDGIEIENGTVELRRRGERIVRIVRSPDAPRGAANVTSSRSPTHSSGLLAHFRFDETQGRKIADASGLGHHDTLETSGMTE
ncbi:MAG: serine/threonine protein kinase [Planctomycetes bacterium]|nr:serine/threonine protein kinase [Planctomycetota bacterium]